MLVLGGFARATPLTGLSADLSWRSSSIFFLHETRVSTTLLGRDPFFFKERHFSNEGN